MCSCLLCVRVFCSGVPRVPRALVVEMSQGDPIDAADGLGVQILNDVVAEYAHPFGNHAFSATLRHRQTLPTRKRVAYDDGEDDAGLEEIQQQQQQHAAMYDGLAVDTAEVDSSMGDDSKKSSDRKRGRSGLVKSVRLPKWMDLDQESLPHRQHAIALVDTSQQDTRKAVLQPSILEETASVGEHTVQLRTSRAPDATFEELLDGHREESKRKQQNLPPADYVCRHCQKPGHWIQDCPTIVRAPAAAPADDELEEGELIEDDADDGSGGVQRREGDAERADEAKPAKVRKFGPPSAGYVCKACHRTGHWLEQCPRYEAYRHGTPPIGYVCRKCNQAGHWVHNCVAMSGKAAASGRRAQDPDATPLEVSEDAAEVGEEIAEALGEIEPEAVTLVGRCVAALGEAACRQLLVQTWQVEGSGGMLTLDGSNRRRTAGGVFFWLVKQKAKGAQRAAIFCGKRADVEPPPLDPNPPS